MGIWLESLTIVAQAAGQGSEQVPPLMKVKAYLGLILLMLILLGLIVFNRLMARWARRNATQARQQQEKRAEKSTYDPDDEAWTHTPIVDDGLDD